MEQRADRLIEADLPPGQRAAAKRGLGVAWRRFVRAPRLIGRLAEFALLLAAATGDFTRRAMEANPGGPPPAGYDPERALFLLARAAGWARALRARLSRERRARPWLDGSSLLALACRRAGPERETDDYAAMAAIASARRDRPPEGRAAERAAEAAYRAEIAGLPAEEVAAQIGADLSEVAAMLGEADAARQIGLIAGQAEEMLSEPLPPPMELKSWYPLPERMPRASALPREARSTERRRKPPW